MEKIDLKEITSLSVMREGNSFKIMPLERFKDENGTEKTRWVNSQSKYFDTMKEALDYIQLHENQMIS